jgi:hypothetical protein
VPAYNQRFTCFADSKHTAAHHADNNDNTATRVLTNRAAKGPKHNQSVQYYDVDSNKLYIAKISDESPSCNNNNVVTVSQLRALTHLGTSARYTCQNSTVAVTADAHTSTVCIAALQAQAHRSNMAQTMRVQCAQGTETFKASRRMATHKAAFSGRVVRAQGVFTSQPCSVPLQRIQQVQRNTHVVCVAAQEAPAAQQNATKEVRNSRSVNCCRRMLVPTLTV